jgi:AcrR family transcriptional regulator
MSPRTRSHRQPDRAATEAALQKAALTLVERNGVLAGLNLREVADEAGVNRGLVYHYFGSRRDLLRAALRADASQRFVDAAPGFGLPAAARYARFLHTFVSHRRAVATAALLTLDGDDSLHAVPDLDGSRGRLGRDVADGHLPPDVDLEGLHVALVALVYGYLVFRDRFSDELDTDGAVLDARVAALVERMVTGLACPRGAAAFADPPGAT